MSDAKLHDEPVHAAHLSGAKADVQRLLAALIKLALVGDTPEAAAWRTEAIDAQRRVATDPAAFTRLNFNGLWSMAVKAAESDPVVRRDETANPMLPTTAPMPLEALFTDPFRLEDTVQAIRDVASFG